MTTNNAQSVLIVDDDRHIRAIIQRWLSAQGYCCAEADNAEAAWKYLQEHEVHLLTLDVMMPGQSGLELLHDVAKTYPDVAVIMLTATGQTQMTTDALTHGASAYLLKPFLREELVFHARKALERRQLVIDKREYMLHLEEKVREQTRMIRRSQEDVIHRLACASTYRDEETGMHVRRTGLLSEVLAKAAGWSVEEAENIRMAAAMHDVGKMAIPDAILRKPGELTAEEFEIMKTHTTIGARLLAGSDSPLLQMAAEIALNHHERWDGSGYPHGTAGDAIPESARILAIVDVYDGLSHDRAYRAALPEEEVLALMQQGAATHFDPALLALFFSHFSEICGIAEEYPDQQGEAEFVGEPPCLVQ
jgi:putative two-component system response regulator